MRLKKSDKQFLLKKIRRYFQTEIIMLFGSYAQGKAHEKSDIDIAIKGKAPLDSAKWQNLETDFEESMFPKAVDIVDYHRVGRDFQKVIDRDGIILGDGKNSPNKKQKIHPWRMCPAGEHWVTTHPMQVSPSENHPEGQITTRHGHCARNPSGKDVLYPVEIREMGERNFNSVKVKPCNLGFDFKEKGKKFDDLIAGWTQYWNEVLRPDSPLEPNLVKALVASESRFLPTLLANKKNPNSARGLTQIKNSTRKILADEKGELKDHYVVVTREDLNDPGTNLCAGIRWLFHERDLATHDLGRTASWEEAVAKYKGILKALGKDQPRAKDLMDRFNGYLEKLKRCGKP